GGPRLRDRIWELGAGTLNADLHVVEARGLQGRQALLREPVRGADEGRVEPELVRLANQILEIPPQGRLATREPELQHTQRLGLAKHAIPFFSQELALE